jgi:hypothetical protein
MEDLTPKVPRGLYQTEYRSAFCRYYAMAFYMEAGGYDYGTSEHRLFVNECIRYDEMANDAFARGE